MNYFRGFCREVPGWCGCNLEKIPRSLYFGTHCKNIGLHRGKEQVIHSSGIHHQRSQYFPNDSVHVHKRCYSKFRGGSQVTHIGGTPRQGSQCFQNGFVYAHKRCYSKFRGGSQGPQTPEQLFRKLKHDASKFWHSIGYPFRRVILVGATIYLVYIFSGVIMFFIVAGVITWAIMSLTSHLRSGRAFGKPMPFDAQNIMRNMKHHGGIRGRVANYVAGAGIISALKMYQRTVGNSQQYAIRAHKIAVSQITNNKEIQDIVGHSMTCSEPHSISTFTVNKKNRGQCEFNINGHRMNGVANIVYSMHNNSQAANSNVQLNDVIIRLSNGKVIKLPSGNEYVDVQYKVKD